jgi:hypothetical protein
MLRSGMFQICAGRPCFGFRHGQLSSLLHDAQTSPRVITVLSTQQEFFPGDKTAGACNWQFTLHVVLRSFTSTPPYAVMTCCFKSQTERRDRYDSDCKGYCVLWDLAPSSRVTVMFAEFQVRGSFAAKTVAADSCEMSENCETARFTFQETSNNCLFFPQSYRASSYSQSFYTNWCPSFFKISIKIYIKTAPTCFGAITILRVRTVWAC